MNKNISFSKEKLEYLNLLSKSYPSIRSASSEYINLSAILNLPKPTEHFLSDIHGEHDTFVHFLSSGSGVIKSKIDEVLVKASEERRCFLSTLISYPRQKLDLLAKQNVLSDDFLREILNDLVIITRFIASKYTRSKVRKKMASEFAYIIDELLQSNFASESKKTYSKEIIKTIIKLGQAESFIVEISHLIRKLAVDHLHILGDIFDRGNGACRIMEKITTLPSVDITWGNHDLLYMGASAGNFACIANTIRNSCRYNHLSTLEDGYGISLRPLVTFAMQFYKDDPCLEFVPRLEEANKVDDYDLSIIAKMHKAITIIQLKVEEQVIRRHPNYKADNLKKISKIDFDKGQVNLDGNIYPLIDTYFPTINKEKPYELSKEEQILMEKLASSYRQSEKLNRHVRFLLSHGSTYLKYNGNLLYHGCIPTLENGEFFTYTNRDGKLFKGKDYLDYCDMKVRKAIISTHPDQDDLDFLWYLWCCPFSPLYGKENIATFERYFLNSIDVKKIEENKNHYYKYINNEEYVSKIMKEFGLDPSKGVIINGHMPVKIIKGESPIKANGKLLIIDGGMSKAYHPITGIAGYTLTYSSKALRLVAHQPFISKENSLINNEDIIHSLTNLKEYPRRLYVKDTDIGKEISKKAEGLKELIFAYKEGIIASK